MVLSCQNVNKAFHEKQVFRNCSFHIEDYEKAAVVGINAVSYTHLDVYKRQSPGGDEDHCRGENRRIWPWGGAHCP